MMRCMLIVPPLMILLHIYVIAPNLLSTVVDILTSVVLITAQVLVVILSFTIASLVFYAFCMRANGDVAIDSESANYVDNNPFWMWNRWG